jgi:hypothetical protein
VGNPGLPLGRRTVNDDRRDMDTTEQQQVENDRRLEAWLEVATPEQLRVGADIANQVAEHGIQSLTPCGQ